MKVGIDEGPRPLSKKWRKLRIAVLFIVFVQHPYKHVRKNTESILSIKVQPSNKKAENQDAFLDKVKALGFNPGAYKFYYKE